MIILHMEVSQHGALAHPIIHVIFVPSGGAGPTSQRRLRPVSDEETLVESGRKMVDEAMTNCRANMI